MSKKERNQEVVFAPETEVIKLEEEQPLFEAEAYGSPQPDAGSDVTVMKPVGIGGPVPIVAPKHNTIQLQPIVVPLAVVPYMTQDSNVLRTDGKPQGGGQYGYAEGEYAEATAFEEVERKIKKRKDIRPRIFSLVTLLVSALIVLPFILSRFGVGSESFDISYLNAIGAIEQWAAGNAPQNILAVITSIVCAAMSGILVLSSLVGLIFGKYPRAFSFIIAVIGAVALLVWLIYALVTKTFVVGESIALIVLVAVTWLNALLALVFSVILNRADDKRDRMRTDAEI